MNPYLLGNVLSDAAVNSALVDHRAKCEVSKYTLTLDSVVQEFPNSLELTNSILTLKSELKR